MELTIGGIDNPLSPGFPAQHTRPTRANVDFVQNEMECVANHPYPYLHEGGNGSSLIHMGRLQVAPGGGQLLHDHPSGPAIG